MMVLRRRRLLIAGCGLVLLAVVALYAATDTSGRIKYLLTWDPTPSGSAQTGTGTGPGTEGPGVVTGGSGSTSGGGITAPRSDFFVDFRLERERTRGQQLEYLREMINNTKVDEEARKTAARDWLELTRQIGKELELEGLIKAKGWSDCVVFLQDKACTVVVKAEKLAQAEAARVGDIIVRGTGLAPQAISISARPE
jgi:stage III sporulation protein AH